MGREYRRRQDGFTLIELMVVMVIMGVMATIGVGAFMSSQVKSRDSRRKSDLKQIAKALETYYTDNNGYPADGSNGRMNACTTSGGVQDCDWATPFRNTVTGTTYMAKLPKEPVSGRRYYYKRYGLAGYELYARLENAEDPEIPTTGTKEYPVFCDDAQTIYCNYVVVDSNRATTPSTR